VKEFWLIGSYAEVEH